MSEATDICQGCGKDLYWDEAAEIYRLASDPDAIFCGAGTDQHEPREQPADDPTPEPRQFVYLVEGETYMGTLDDYRRAYEVAHYSGLSISTRLWSLRVVDGLDGLSEPFPALERHDVRVESREASVDYRSLTFHCLDQVAHGRIDLRA